MSTCHLCCHRGAAWPFLPAALCCSTGMGPPKPDRDSKTGCWEGWAGAARLCPSVPLLRLVLSHVLCYQLWPQGWPVPRQRKWPFGQGSSPSVCPLPVESGHVRLMSVMSACLQCASRGTLHAWAGVCYLLGRVLSLDSAWGSGSLQTTASLP